jgi:peptide/nickel transport system ATP-binding protein
VTRDAAARADGVTTIETRDLSLGYRRDGVLRRVVADVSIALRRNGIVGLAGESGCGKSTLALALTGYQPSGLEVISGSVWLGELELTALQRAALRRIWGARVAYLPQDTSTALNPAIRVGSQLVEAQRRHLDQTRQQARRRAVELLEMVRVPAARDALRRYPHQFSGGQQQRIALAIAMACEPEVLILDEPTTGLDVTTQADVNRLITELAREGGTAMLYVSHNLALLGTVCDELMIMYGGQIIEVGAAREVYVRPRHPYTAALIDAVPSVRDTTPPRGILGMPPLTVVDSRCGFMDRCSRRVDACAQPIALEPRGPTLVRCIRPVTADVARRRLTEAPAVAAIAGEPGSRCDRPAVLL